MLLDANTLVGSFKSNIPRGILGFLFPHLLIYDGGLHHRKMISQNV